MILANIFAMDPSNKTFRTTATVDHSYSTSAFPYSENLKETLPKVDFLIESTKLPQELLNYLHKLHFRMIKGKNIAAFRLMMSMDRNDEPTNGPPYSSSLKGTWRVGIIIYCDDASSISIWWGYHYVPNDTVYADEGLLFDLTMTQYGKKQSRLTVHQTKNDEIKIGFTHFRDNLKTPETNRSIQFRLPAEDIKKFNDSL